MFMLMLTCNILNCSDNFTDVRRRIMDISAAKLVAKYICCLDLQPHVEGGYFRQIYKANDKVIPEHSRYAGQNRSAGTSIYYLLSENNYSAWHRLLSDEIWHYYDGAPTRIHLVNLEGKYQTLLLGNPLRQQEASLQVVIQAGCWFAAEVSDKTSFCLAGCAVFPGFEYKDFELANSDDIDAIVKQCPEQEDIIRRLAPIISSN